MHDTSLISILSVYYTCDNNYDHLNVLSEGNGLTYKKEKANFNSNPSLALFAVKSHIIDEHYISDCG